MILDLTKKLTITGFLAISLYLLCNLNVYSLFIMSVIWPIFILIAHYLNYSIATPKQRFSNKFDTIKIIAFSLQNFLAFLSLYLDSQLMLTIVVNVAFRLNILDMIRQCYSDRNYMYAIAGIPLLCWPIFDAQFHPQFLFEVTNVSSSFVVLYLLWVGGCVLKVGKDNATVILHPLLPLMFPNNLWFAARTFTGVNLIWMLFFRPTYDYLADTRMHTQKIQEFSKVYDSLFPLIFLGLMIQLLIKQLGFY